MSWITEKVSPSVVFCAVARHYSATFRAEEATDSGLLGLPANLANASLTRKIEFLAGRFCAEKAIKAFDPKLTSAVEIGSDRAPKWPTGFVGSITHTRGFASAVVARQEDLKGIGIDSEQELEANQASGIASIVCTQDELEAFDCSLGLTWEQYVTLMFSAKESIFKCLFPVVKRFFEFRDFSLVNLAPQTNQFTFAAQTDLGFEVSKGFTVAGHYEMSHGYVHTAVELFHR